MKRKFTLRLDTSKNGIDAVFKPWQNEAVNILLEANEEHRSSEMLMRLRARGHDISRASVINFLQDLSKENLVTKREESTRGGYTGIYKIAETRGEFNDTVICLFLYKIIEAFPNLTHIELTKGPCENGWIYHSRARAES